MATAPRALFHAISPDHSAVLQGILLGIAAIMRA